MLSNNLVNWGFLPELKLIVLGYAGDRMLSPVDLFCD